MKETKELSEFIAAQDIELYVKEGKPCGSEEGAIPLKISKGGKIPELFVQTFLLHNTNFISNLVTENGVIKLTKEQEKKYDLVFDQPKAESFKIKPHKHTQEKLTIRLNKLGSKNFKVWAEKEFGEDTIDRRRSGSAIITDILRFQEEEKR